LEWSKACSQLWILSPYAYHLAFTTLAFTLLWTYTNRCKTYLQRIREVNGTLHMVTETNPDALSIAADLDAQRAAGNIIGYAFMTAVG